MKRVPWARTKGAVAAMGAYGTAATRALAASTACMGSWRRVSEKGGKWWKWAENMI